MLPISADIGSVIVYGLLVGLMASLIGGPLFLKFLGQRLPFKPVPTEFADLKVRDEKTLPSLGATLFTILLPIALMLVKTIAELNMARESGLYTLLEFIGNPITAMFIAVFVAYYVLGIRQHMSMGTMLTHTENGFGSIANILLIIEPEAHSNAILKAAVSLIRLAVILSNMHMHPILSGLVGGTYSACCSGLRYGGNDGATAIVATHAAAAYPDISPEIIADCYRFRCDWLHDRYGLAFLAGEASQALRSMKHLNTIRQRHLSLRSSLWRAHSCCHLSSKRKETYYGKR